jgi:hypothetical protein
MAFLENSASAPTMAMVAGLGFCAIAASKKPELMVALASGPFGVIDT